MVNLTFNAAALGPVLLVLVLSLVIGVVLALLNAVGGFALGIIIGFAKAVARDNSSWGTPARPHKGVIFVRTLIYVALCIGAIVLSLSGHEGWAYLSAIAGGVALPIAIGKLLD